MLLPRRSLCLALTLLLISAPLASAQTLARGAQDPLGAYPGNTDALSAIDFRPQNIQAALQALPEETRAELQQSLQSLMLEFQREGMQGLLTALSQVAGHMSVAYRKTPNRWGEVLFQIETHHENTLNTALSSLGEVPFQSENFGGYTLHRLTFDEKQGAELAGLQLTLAQQGKYIRGSFGFDASGLKEMLYLDQVHPVQSPWRLSGQADVQRAQRVLSPDQQQWTYVRTTRFRELMRYVLDTQAPAPLSLEEDPWYQDMLSYVQGMGVGVQIDTHEPGTSALHIQALTQHNPKALSDYQHAVISRDQADQAYDFSGLMAYFPAPLTAFYAGHFHGFEDFKIIPSNHQMSEGWKAFLEEGDTAGWQARLLESTGLNYAEDLAPYVAGPFALAWMPALSPAQIPTNPVGLVVDLKPGKALAEHLSQTFISGSHSPVQLKRLQGNPVYRLDLALNTNDIQEIESVLPGLLRGSADPALDQAPALYFMQQAATATAPARFLLSNHLQALEQMATRPAAKHPYFRGKVPSQYHLYINTPLLAERLQISPEDKDFLVPFTDYLQSFYGRQTHSPEGITNDWLFKTTSKANPWLKLAETVPLPFALVGGIAIPNFLGVQTRARQSSTKANMHTLQTLIETYAVDTGGRYPETLEILKAEVEANDYWKDYSNPYDEDLPSYLSLQDYLTRSVKPEGVAIYEPLFSSESDRVTGYRIYGTNEQGLLLVENEAPEKPFILGSYSAESAEPNLLLAPHLEPRPLVDTQRMSAAFSPVTSQSDASSRMSETLTQSNMLAYRVMVEIYRAESGGLPPENFSVLQKHAKDNGYWLEIENPFGPDEPILISMQDYLKRPIKPKGAVIYQYPVPAGKEEAIYLIYGTDANGAYIKEASSEEALILTASDAPENEKE